MYVITPFMSPLTCASVMAKSAYVLYTNAALAPRATSVSIFGARCHKLLNPLMKKRWLMTMMTTVSSSCDSPIATWFPS